MLMGINNLPEINNYWSTDDGLGNEFIKKSMSRNRYQSILRYLHVNDSLSQSEKGDESYDKLFKIRPLLDHPEKTFLDNFVPLKEVSVDEAMVKFKGRLGFIQYMPMKPIKRGVKVWMSACPSTGYAFTFDVYTGRNNDGSVETGLGHKLVMKLPKSMHGSYRQIYFDNYFNSPQ
ncbi:hypothetical protein SNE40_015322 [Patella caerulea]|uniref:PiggyBac transposable element-derived protein domain-containing protein n=1 Tax=Patella caerulea TaxID=87958 RepID=A0AAN8PV09_PATCE